jgi:predicted amidophosphoribosyltransferase
MNRLPTLKFWFCALRGLVRLYFGNCPECNSDAPRTFNCDVCGYGGVHDRHWQDRWLLKLRAKYL